MESKRIRVLVTDDHAVVRNGLASFLMAFEEFELVGEAKNGEHALDLCDQFLPDIVLMDLVMPVMDGATATRLIREKHPSIQIIALTSFKERDLVQTAIQSGAIGYLMKDISSEELAKAIHMAMAGKPTLAPEAAEVLIQATRDPELKPGIDLTEREREILALMVEGCNNQQIAERLVIGVSTVKSHVSHVLSKLGVATRTEAVSYALQNKLV